MELNLEAKDLDEIEDILRTDLIESGVHCVLLIDLAGNIVAGLDNGNNTRDLYSLAALAAGNFGAMSEMAKLIGEDEFSLLFHKGQKESIHFSKVLNEFLLVTIFGEEVALGFIRLKVGDVNARLKDILGRGLK